MSAAKKLHYCSFCGKSHPEVSHMVVSPYDANICNECVELCARVMYPGEAEYQSWLPAAAPA